jgi:superfamily II DNA helicase RecQ
MDGFQCSICLRLFASKSPAYNHKNKACTEATLFSRKVTIRPGVSHTKERLSSEDLILVSSNLEQSSESVLFAVNAAAGMAKKEEKEGEADSNEGEGADKWAQKEQQLLVALSWTEDLGTEAKRKALVRFLPVKDAKSKFAKYKIWKEVEKAWSKQLEFAKSLPALTKWVVADGPGKPKLVWKVPMKELTLERRKELLFCLLFFMWQRQLEQQQENGGGGDSDIGFDVQSIQDLVFRGRVDNVQVKMDIELFVMALLCQKGGPRRTREVGIGSASTLDKSIKDLIWLLQLFALSNLSIKDGQLDYEEGEFVNELSLGFNAYTCLKNIQSQVVKILKASRNEAGVLTKVVPKDAVGLCVFVEGEPIEADFLHCTFEKFIKCIKEKMAWLAGVENVDSDLQLQFGHVLDDLTTAEEQPGYYGFCLDPGNTPADTTPTSCWGRIIGKHPDLVEAGNKSFSKSRAQEWMREADSVIQLILVALHISSGGAARGTELELLSFANSFARHRTMFVMDGSVCTVLAVPKSEQLAGGMKKPVPRKLEPSLGLLVLKYMVYLRAAHHVLSQEYVINPAGTTTKENREKKAKDLQETFWHHFLVHRGKRGTADWITLTFKTMLKRVMHINMSFSSYRHYVEYVGSNYLLPLVLHARSILAEFNDEELKQAWTREECLVQMLILPVQHHLTLQSGHAIVTADLQYGVNPASHPVCPWDLMKKFLHVSNVWHELVLSKSLKQELVLMLAAKDKSFGRGNSPLSYPWICSVDPSSGSYFTVENAFAACQGSVDEHHGSDLCLEFALKAGFGVPKFKSSAQEAAVKTVLGIGVGVNIGVGVDIGGGVDNVVAAGGRKAKSHNNNNVLVVLPTGGGKSLVAFFPPVLDIFHYKATKGLTVVISPLISLRDSMIAKLLGDEKLPQPACILWQDLLASPKLLVSFYQHHFVRTTILFLFVTAEGAQTHQFQTFYKVMTGLDKISRVVVDEAHNVVCASSYRDAYQNIGFLMQPDLLNDHDKGGGGGRGEKEGILKKHKKIEEGGRKLIPPKRIPCTLLSATIPAGNGDFERKLFDTLGIPSRLFPTEEMHKHEIEIVRADVVTRSELSLAVKKIGDERSQSLEPLFDAVCCAVTNYLFPGENTELRGGCQSHVLVYVHSLAACGELQEKLEACFSGVPILAETVKNFHGKLDAERKLEIGNWWFESNIGGAGGRGMPNSRFLAGRPPKILVATTAFGEGLDHPAVGLVIHCGLAYSIINLLQEIGRAARNSRNSDFVKVGMALYLHHPNLYGKMVKNMAALQEVGDGYVNTNGCRWKVFGSAFDNNDLKTCASIGCDVSCDMCWDPVAKHGVHWSQVLLEQDTMKKQLQALKIAGNVGGGVGGGVGGAEGNDDGEHHAFANVHDFAYVDAPSTPIAIGAHNSNSLDPGSTPMQQNVEVPHPIPDLEAVVEPDLWELIIAWKSWIATTVCGANCWVCDSGAHQWNLCPFWKERCFRCYQKGHIVQACPIRKPTEPLNLICFSCYLPFEHCIKVSGHYEMVKFPIISNSSVCAERILRPILVLNVLEFGNFDRDMQLFERWYLDPERSWFDRFRFIMGIIEEKFPRASIN